MLQQRILFIDDDLAFLDMIERTFRAWSKGAMDILLAHSAGQAITHLQTGTVSIAVIDIHMPVVDGLQFLHLLHRKHPNTRKIILTGYAEADFRAACLKGGAELFLQKPRTSADFETVFAAITELLRVSVDNGFTGSLVRVGLHEILQLECLARRSSILEVASNAIRGRIFIREGGVCHAETNGLTGHDAFYYLMSLTGGAFQLKEFIEPSEDTINGPWEFLLMESSRLRDEGGDLPDPEMTDSASLISDLPVLPFSPLLLASTASLPATNSDPADKKRTQRLSRPTPPMPEPVLANPAPVPTVKPTVEECVTTHPDGTVRAAWKSADPELRANFIEFLRFKSRQIAQGLGVGSFRRIEAYTVREMIVAEPRRDMGIYVRGRGAAAAPDDLLTVGLEQVSNDTEGQPR